MSWIVHISKICIDCIRTNPNNVEFAFNDNDPVLPVDSPNNWLVMRGFDVLLVVNRNKFFNKKIGLLMISDAMVHIWGHCKDNPKYLNSCINMFKYRVSWNILITLWWNPHVGWISMADMLRVFVTSSILRENIPWRHYFDDNLFQYIPQWKNINQFVHGCWKKK